MKKDEVLRVIEEAVRDKPVVLYLPDNQLTSLPAEIVELKNLTTLDLSENHLESPPIEIAKQGPMVIRSYFESLEAKKLKRKR